jgi:hypothetical protein
MSGLQGIEAGEAKLPSTDEPSIRAEKWLRSLVAVR